MKVKDRSSIPGRSFVKLRLKLVEFLPLGNLPRKHSADVKAFDSKNQFSHDFFSLFGPRVKIGMPIHLYQWHFGPYSCHCFINNLFNLFHNTRMSGALNFVMNIQRLNKPLLHARWLHIPDTTLYLFCDQSSIALNFMICSSSHISCLQSECCCK